MAASVRKLLLRGTQKVTNLNMPPEHEKLLESLWESFLTNSFAVVYRNVDQREAQASDKKQKCFLFVLALILWTA